jgi:tetratricopeptide (TPR) repeat protein
LRDALGAASQRLVSPDNRTILLDIDRDNLDIAAFDFLTKQGDALSLQRAVEIYRGPLLEGYGESWIIPERVAREQMYLVALESLANQALKQGDLSASATYLTRLLAVDPARETALRMLLKTLAALGNYPSAITAYRNFRVHLRTELNLQPAAETQALYEQIKGEMSRAVPVVPTEESHVATGEAIGGAVALNSPYYLERITDARFHGALARGDSIVLVKGPRQVGKSSLLSRGLQKCRAMGYRVVVSDLQKLTARDLESAETLLLAFARQLTNRLKLETSPDKLWDTGSSANENFDHFLETHVLGTSSERLVWALDEVDQLFPYRFSSEVFGLFRSWHNERALDPEGSWSRLTLAMAYATEAHLFITDLNQSPFNVGTRLILDDFTLDEVAELNQRLNTPLPDAASLNSFYSLLGGHPYLVRRGLQELVSRDCENMTVLAARADRDDGPFGDHLRRLVFVLTRDPGLSHTMREILRGKPCPELWSFYRLRSAGVVTGDDLATARPRCGLYARYLERYLL